MSPAPVAAVTGVTSVTSVVGAPVAAAGVTPRPAPHNPFAVERPHAAPHLLERQGSFRGFAHLNNR